MKHRWTLAALALAGLAGCHSSSTVNRDLKPKGPVNEFQRDTNEAISMSVDEQMVSAAVIREHTLFPYHFVMHSASLNELGWRDVRWLAAHYVSNPGPLNVRQGSTPDELYKARVRTVVTAMTDRGVRHDRIKVTDGMPGGDGMSSDQVVVIMERMIQDTGAASSADKAEDKNKSGDMNKSNTPSPSSIGAGTSVGGKY